MGVAAHRDVDQAQKAGSPHGQAGVCMVKFQGTFKLNDQALEGLETAQ